MKIQMHEIKIKDIAAGYIDSAEAGVVASLVNYDLEKALADATAALPDPKSWEALEKSEKSQQEAA